MTTTTKHKTGGRLPEHAPRLDWARLAPEAYQAQIRLDTITGKGAEPLLLNLVKIRASQLNHCAFCLDMHSKDALAAGESAQRIVALDAWTESRHFYTAKEVAAIANEFNETELAHLIAAITASNAWNRFGVSTRMVPGHYTPCA